MSLDDHQGRAYAVRALMQLAADDIRSGGEIREAVQTQAETRPGSAARRITSIRWWRRSAPRTSDGYEQITSTHG